MVRCQDMKETGSLDGEYKRDEVGNKNNCLCVGNGRSNIVLTIINKNRSQFRDEKTNTVVNTDDKII